MRLAAALLVLLLAAAPAWAGEPRPLTRSDVKSLSDEALAKRIFGPLAAGLFVSRPTMSSRTWEGAQIWFWTRPRKDWLRDGLCVTDRLTVRLSPAPMAVTRDPAMQVSGIETETNYIVRDREMATRLTGFDPKELVGQDEACARLDPRRDSTPAENGWQLMKALEVVEELGAAARAGRAPVPVDCTQLRFSGPPASEPECLKALSTLGRHSVAAIQSCGDPVVTRDLCIRVQTWEWFIYFVLDWGHQKMERVIVQGIEDNSAIE
jgi:hypothetical protein